MGLQRRLRGVYMGAPHCKAILGRKFSKSCQKRAQKWRIFENYGVQNNVNFCLIPKRHTLARNRGVWRITRENRFRGLGCGALEARPKKKPSKHFWCAISRIRGKETPWGIVTKLCELVDGRDWITCATSGGDQWKGLDVASGRVSGFSIDLSRRPYKTLALQCECVILCFWLFFNKKVEMTLCTLPTFVSNYNIVWPTVNFFNVYGHLLCYSVTYDVDVHQSPERISVKFSG